jgi:hypothetical protein
MCLLKVYISTSLEARFFRGLLFVIDAHSTLTFARNEDVGSVFRVVVGSHIEVLDDKHGETKTLEGEKELQQNH